jgi:class 3 adenylate cyclase
VTLAAILTDRIRNLVDGANAEIDEANAQAAAVQQLNRNVLIGVVVLSLVSSFLIVWLYVGRNLIARLTALSDSMLAIAGGNLRVPLPATRGGDEISRMAEALVVFRDTAIEVEETNLREIEEAQRRLVDAIENSSEGFAFYDPDDKLVICNTRYKELLYPNAEINIEPGMSFETTIRTAAEGGHILDAEGRIDEWVAERLEIHLNPGEARLQQRGRGQWIMITERKTGDGGTVAIYSDVTDLKQREEELTKKSNALEQLSNQLAKYLSPQVYDSIFAGKQEVKLVSQRKRLTVFFSDLVGFTETAERLESEDLTRLLNQYLTEMSQIALAHGATIDKFVGDAIVIFFGDPETLGIEEDARACVKMAIAMRKRMGELEYIWKDSGLEKPLQCRMGINTGVCTVGNFGSEDRMDYTIIGGGVNLAARLESACAPTEILISYETYAHVKDLVHCEERDEISVKGVAHPVTTYQVVDLREDLGEGMQLIRAKLPHFQLDLDMTLMSPDEQREALAVLLDSVERLSNSSTKA